MRTTIVLFVTALALGGIPGLGPGAARADVVEDTGHHLPSGRTSGSAVWTGSEVLYFGGWSGAALNTIVRYDPATGLATTAQAHLPTARHWTSAVWSGQVAYVFGGVDTGQLDQVLRYDPALDQLTVLPQRLPFGRSYTSAMWDGTAAYVIGGSYALNTFTDQIVRFDPAAGTVEVLAARLPAGRDSMALAWTGTVAYLFGGVGRDGVHTDGVVRFDPASGQVVEMGAQLPSPRGRMSVSWDGQQVVLFGGRDANAAFLDDVLRYDPATDQVTRMPTRLPSPRMSGVSLASGGWHYVLGHVAGTDQSHVYLDEVLRYHPDLPGLPRAFLAYGGPGPGDVTMRWQPPHHAEEDGVQGYRLARGALGQPLATIALLPVDARTYTDHGLDPTATYVYALHAIGPRAEGPAARSCTPPAPAHALPSVGPPCPAPEGWRETVLMRRSVPVAVGPGGNVVEVHGRPSPFDPRAYELRVRAAGQELPAVAVYTGGAAQEPFDLVVPAPVERGQLDAAVALRSDPSEPVCLVRVGASCVAGSPLDPADAAWLAGPGTRAELVVTLRASADAREVAALAVRVPFVGQLTAPPPR